MAILPIGVNHMNASIYMLIALHLYSSWTKCCILLFAVDTMAIIHTQYIKIINSAKINESVKVNSMSDIEKIMIHQKISERFANFFHFADINIAATTEPSQAEANKYPRPVAF